MTMHDDVTQCKHGTVRTVDELVAALRVGLAQRADPDTAVAMRAYMRGVEAFRGVPKPAREQLLRAALAARPVPDAAALRRAVTRLWDGARYREERYLALALAGHRRHAAWPDASWVPLYRRWVVEGAWWDTTDEIATRLVGRLLRADPATLAPTLRGWAAAEDRWLRRTAVIAQIGSKAATDTALLGAAVEANLDDPDFFLRKAIGWALRQHARTDPAWVRAFVAAHPGLSALSVREALRHLGPPNG
jgi:3-methyladenine DNA glycosylase AlkD